jgi:cobalt/nickel transport system permease protein
MQNSDNTARLPDWMGVSGESVATLDHPHHFHQFLRKALGGFARMLEELLDNEAIALRHGLLQQLDPRSKVLGIFGLIVISTFLTHLSTLGMAFGLAVLFCLSSQVPLSRLLRLWTIVPLFSAAIMAPALLNIVTPGIPLLSWKGLAITDAGLFCFSRFILRLTTCVSFALALTATTKAPQLFRGLRALGVPKLFVTMLGMMERYLTVLIKVAQEIHLAKVSRTVAQGSLYQEQSWLAAGMGSLFQRTWALGNEVFYAMVSRGYTGAVVTLDEPRFQLMDWGFLMVTCGLGVIFLVMR